MALAKAAELLRSPRKAVLLASYLVLIFLKVESG